MGASDAAAKLEHARGLLRRAEDRAVRDRPAPEVDGGVVDGVDGAGGRVLPVVAKPWAATKSASAPSPQPTTTAERPVPEPASQSAGRAEGRCGPRAW